jgi:hypothetical protein
MYGGEVDDAGAGAFRIAASNSLQEYPPMPSPVVLVHEAKARVEKIKTALDRDPDNKVKQRAYTEAIRDLSWIRYVLEGPTPA